jgi:uncharacterized membrane protein
MIDANLSEAMTRSAFVNLFSTPYARLLNSLNSIIIVHKCARGGGAWPQSHQGVCGGGGGGEAEANTSV